MGLLRKLFGRVVVLREPSQRCGNCVSFESFPDPDGDPDDVDGYCGESHHAAANYPYGGHWVHSRSWCRYWAPESDDAVGQRNG